jgi:transcriptional regulator with XRE-family HTH domain
VTDPVDWSDYRSEIIALREQGWTYQRIAGQTGVSLSTVYNIVKGKTTRPYRRHKQIAKSTSVRTTQDGRSFNWAYRLWFQAKKRAEKKGCPFLISPEDVVIPDVCPVFGTPFTFESLSGKQGGTDTSASIDRLVPELGYVPGNIRIISWRANRLKSNATHEELRTLADWLAKELAPKRSVIEELRARLAEKK